MTTHLYVLQESGTNTVMDISPCWGASRVVVRDRNWYQARKSCIQHAIDNGIAKFIVMVGTVEVHHRPHWNRQGPETRASLCNEAQQHGAWTYFDRLLNRFGHVYMPPLTAMRTWASLKKHPWSYYNTPVIPSVAGYQTRAVAQLIGHGPGLGALLCGLGYDSFNMSDYFFYDLGKTVLDETGTITSWSNAYERAIRRHY